MRGREINHQEGVRGREKGCHLGKNSWNSGVLPEGLLLHLLLQIQSVKSLFLPKTLLLGPLHLNTMVRNYRTIIVSAYDLFDSAGHILVSTRSKCPEGTGHKLFQSLMDHLKLITGKAPNEFQNMKNVVNIPSPLSSLNGRQLCRLYQFLNNNGQYRLLPVISGF